MIPTVHLVSIVSVHSLTWRALSPALVVQNLQGRETWCESMPPVRKSSGKQKQRRSSKKDDACVDAAAQGITCRALPAVMLPNVFCLRQTAHASNPF